MKPPVIPLPDAVVTISEENFRVPVRYSGHGLQRALILALLEQLSMSQPRKSVTDGTGDTAPQAAARLPDLILAIEEPELYLHPARSRYLAAILRGLAHRTPNMEGGGTQVVSVTHSPYFVDAEFLDEVRMCRKESPAEENRPRMTRIKGFTRLEASQRLAQVTGRPPEEFTAATFVARAAPVLNSIVNEGLFADVAVVVEGESDVAALWATQKLLDKNWDELGVVVVPVGGKNNIDRAVVAFQGFEVPTYFMFDGDKSKEEGAMTNRSLQRLGHIDIVDYPDTKVTEHCAIFEEDIEQYLQSVALNRYLPLRDRCAGICGHDRPSTALKNSEVMAMFLREAQSEGINFSILRQIVETISYIATSLRTNPTTRRAIHIQEA